jgi:hypothetical protein
MIKCINLLMAYVASKKRGDRKLKELNKSKFGTSNLNDILEYVVTSHFVDLRIADSGKDFIEQIEKAMTNKKLNVSDFYRDCYTFLLGGLDYPECKEEEE